MVIQRNCKLGRCTSFESFWLEHDECKRVVGEAWAAPYLSRSSISQKIRATIRALTKWSKSTFSANHTQIALLQQQLQQYTNQPVFEITTALLLHIWKARNQLLFRNQRTHPDIIVDTALQLETDNLILVETMNRSRLPPWNCRALFAQCESLMLCFPHLSLQHYRREHNALAD